MRRVAFAANNSTTVEDGIAIGDEHRDKNGPWYAFASSEEMAVRREDRLAEGENR
jgi:hypothetical protein